MKSTNESFIFDRFQYNSLIIIIIFTRFTFHLLCRYFVKTDLLNQFYLIMIIIYKFIEIKNYTD